VRNRALKGGGKISTDSSRVRIYVVPANEELIVARETAAVVQRAVAAQTQEYCAR